MQPPTGTTRTMMVERLAGARRHRATRRGLGGLLGLGLLAALVGTAWAGVKTAPPPDQATRTRLQEGFGKLPLYFIENRGQVDPQVSHYLQGSDKRIYFTKDGLMIVLTPPHASVSARNRIVTDAPTAPRTSQVVTLQFLDANPAVTPIGQDPTEAVISYFKGPQAQWKTGLPTYGTVAYRQLWPGIDLHYTGAHSQLKYTFTLQPGADPARIRLAYRGIDRLALTEAGGLIASTPAGSLHDGVPVAWQDFPTGRRMVTARFTLDPNTHTVGFALGAYDPRAPLILDPAVLVYAGFIGGSERDYGRGIAVDGSGQAYVTGYTESTAATFPETVGPDLTYNGGGDAFIAKVSADGTGLVYAGCIGGSGWDEGYSIAVDGSGHAYVTGLTTSTEATFPVTVGPDLTYNGGGDAFIAKVNAAGTALLYAGFLGGSGADWGHGIAVDGGGNAYVTGLTTSTEATFPVTVGPDLTYNGGGDAFIAKVHAAGTHLVYAGYIGGSGSERGDGIAVDGGGNAYVTGFTTSTEATFPVTVGPDLTYNGGYDAFVAKVNAAGTHLVYAGYIGGSGDDWGHGIAVDGSGHAYVTGLTYSSQTTFPVTVGPDLTHNGGGDAFVAKVTAAGTALVYAGFVGGSGDDYGQGIAVDGSGNAYVTGYTSSTEATFPVTVGPDLTYNGGYDAFVAKIGASADTTPDPFTFTDVTGVPLSTVQTSNAITVSGITAPAAISIVGGEYELNGSGTWTSSAGTVVNGDAVKVRHTSATAFSTAVHTTLTIGGVADTFTSTTAAPPSPDIKANGSDGPLSILYWIDLTVTVSLDPGAHAGVPADWWVAATSPMGLYWYTLDYGWVRSDTPLRVYGGPLAPLPLYPVLHTATLPLGSYTFYFGVDLLPNGALDWDRLAVDSVGVTIHWP